MRNSPAPPDMGLARRSMRKKRAWAAAGAPKIMARLLAASTADDETAGAIAKELGWSKKRVRDSLVTKRQPDDEGQRMGKFGEVPPRRDTRGVSGHGGGHEAVQVQPHPKTPPCTGST